MFTSNYKNFNNTDPREISISSDMGKNVNYIGKSYPALIPKNTICQILNNNNKITEEEINDYYIEEYYRQVLSKLDPNQVYDDLKDSILLCYEEPDDFCHRHIVAEWINLLFNESVKEIFIEDNYYYETTRYSGIKPILERIIKKYTRDLHGFNSLCALRLFNKSKQIEERINNSTFNSKNVNNYLITEAQELKSLAYQIEKEYIRSKNNILLYSRKKYY